MGTLEKYLFAHRLAAQDRIATPIEFRVDHMKTLERHQQYPKRQEFKTTSGPSVMAHAFNPNTRGRQSGRLISVNSGLHSRLFRK